MGRPRWMLVNYRECAAHAQKLYKPLLVLAWLRGGRGKREVKSGSTNATAERLSSCMQTTTTRLCLQSSPFFMLPQELERKLQHRSGTKDWSLRLRLEVASSKCSTTRRRIITQQSSLDYAPTPLSDTSKISAMDVGTFNLAYISVRMGFLYTACLPVQVSSLSLRTKTPVNTRFLS
ncbi:hypothetical protein AUEXF2481DRAFT_335328 [Aureobasidium subglaciale EXF-2481]|uniref:Uncharacterized protein n=1 Tax=Aureobasidium subglaciale (strain EXF-2481) TaxID=1043005 RepID=A0A074Z2J3_AURSE|nr:uncharacterized protein AUEXF2481DRAFT_335328 [Aureobasidium subglaciale EXF-2481]KEQ93291.1 hypothetical protein AUEXF2481DRAFT_335328 [Aureobasidium subglaciale EXF-2481]